MMRPYDLAIIGGGINGTGIARDAAGRGLRVLLMEKADLASATSSASTKLIHGGLRYLEHYAFRLVRESLQERERLLAIAPHIIWPMRFVLPHAAGMRPAWMLRLGLFLYDHIGGRKNLPPTRTLDLKHDEAGAPLQPGFGRAFEYSDLWVNDARLVVLNARDAAKRGATILTRTELVSARRMPFDGTPLWELKARDENGAEIAHTARILVNAAGPWAGSVTNEVMGLNVPARVRMVKGSHIIVPRLFAHERAYLFQNRDGRIIFAIPYEGDFTLIGTTDLDFSGNPAEVRISEDEIAYLAAAASEYFAKPILPEHVVWTYSGVRPLYDDGASKAQEATRDYVLHLDAPDGEAPALSVFGGKLTTYRRLAEHALEKLGAFLPATASRGSWTTGEALPGGDFPINGFDTLVKQVLDVAPFLGEKTARRLARAYGTDALKMLEGVKSAGDLGTDYGAGLTSREIEWMRREEWAGSAEDILWRRSKLGLHMSKDQRDAVAALF